jgi:hypothetical protein
MKFNQTNSGPVVFLNVYLEVIVITVSLSTDYECRSSSLAKSITV